MVDIFGAMVEEVKLSDDFWLLEDLDVSSSRAFAQWVGLSSAHLSSSVHCKRSVAIQVSSLSTCNCTDYFPRFEKEDLLSCNSKRTPRGNDILFCGSKCGSFGGLLVSCVAFAIARSGVFHSRHGEIEFD